MKPYIRYNIHDYYISPEVVKKELERKKGTMKIVENKNKNRCAKIGTLPPGTLYKHDPYGDLYMILPKDCQDPNNSYSVTVLSLTHNSKNFTHKECVDYILYEGTITIERKN